jgi:hypothetical protein
MPVRALPRLIFEVSEGFGNSLVQSTLADTSAGRFEVLDAQLQNVYAALKPLTAHYSVDVLIYPCHLYNATAPGSADPLKRVHPGLHRFLRFFNQTDIGVFLEIYSSGIMTQQVGARMGTLPPTPLYNASSEPGYIGLSMDIETVVALKHAYPKAMIGVRFHEVYGCDSVWRGDGQKDCFQLAPEIFVAYIDMCAAHGMKFFHNDQSWLLRYDLGSGPWSYHAHAPAYYETKLLLHNSSTTVAYASSKLGKAALLTYENNNGFPTPDLEYFDSAVDPGNKSFPVPGWMEWNYGSAGVDQFPMRRGGNGWGISTQPWAWFEWVHTLTTLPYWTHGEMHCPIEMMQQYALKAIAGGADVVHFEPSWFFFDEYFPSCNDSVALEGPLLKGSMPTHAERLALKRMKTVLIAVASAATPVPPMPSADLADTFDVDQQRFLSNMAHARPKNYKQTTLLLLPPQVGNEHEAYATKISGRGKLNRTTSTTSSDKSSTAIDFYTDGRVWQVQGLPPFTAAVTQGAHALSGIELTGDYCDEVMVTRSNLTHTTLHFYFSWGGELRGSSIALPLAVGDEAGGTNCHFHSAISGNFMPSSAPFMPSKPKGSQGDPDELIVTRVCDSGVNTSSFMSFELWQMASFTWGGSGAQKGVSMKYERSAPSLEAAVLGELLGLQPSGTNSSGDRSVHQSVESVTAAEFAGVLTVHVDAAISATDATRALDRLALFRTVGNFGSANGAISGVDARAINVTIRSARFVAIPPPRQRDNQCGAVDMGASGAWLATDKSCTNTNTTEAACCCQAKCAAYAGCEAWQLISKAGLPDSGWCYLKNDTAMAPNPAGISGKVTPAPAPHIYVFPGPTTSFMLSAKDYCADSVPLDGATSDSPMRCSMVTQALDVDFAHPGDELLIWNNSGIFDVYTGLLTSNATTKDPDPTGGVVLARSWRKGMSLGASRCLIPPKAAAGYS